MKKIILILMVFVMLFTIVSPENARAQTHKTPQAAAQSLYQAWRVKNRKTALKVADKSAVDKLFSTRWRALKFKGCTNRDEGGFECIYNDAKLDLSIAFILDGGASAGGYSVVSVSFSSEE